MPSTSPNRQRRFWISQIRAGNRAAILQCGEQPLPIQSWGLSAPKLFWYKRLINYDQLWRSRAQREREVSLNQLPDPGLLHGGNDESLLLSGTGLESLKALAHLFDSTPEAFC